MMQASSDSQLEWTNCAHATASSTGVNYDMTLCSGERHARI
jgi:hypothetical protein